MTSATLARWEADVTTNALDARTGSLLSVWAAGVGHHATVVCQLDLPAPGAGLSAEPGQHRNAER